MVKAGLITVLVGGTLVLPVQEAGAAACRYTNGHKVCTTTPVHHPKTVCTTTHGVKHCRKVY